MSSVIDWADTHALPGGDKRGAGGEQYPLGFMILIGASAEEKKIKESQMKLATAKYICDKEYSLNHSEFRAALSPLVAEVVGAEFCHMLRIGAPDKIKTADKQEALAAIKTNEWVAKVVLDGRLRAIGVTDCNVLVRRIPKAISLYALRMQCGIESRAMHLSSAFEFDVELGLAENIVRNGAYATMLGQLAAVIQQGDLKSYFTVCDFELPADSSKIIAAVQWDSTQMLAIHAARLFLGCSAAHVGNVLVDVDAKLFSIDHESVAWTDGEELVLLFDNVARGTRAWRSLAGVAQLTHENIAALFAAVPDHAYWPLGDKRTTVNYFTGRLDYWRFKYANSQN